MKDKMHDAGCTTGMDVGSGTGVSGASLKRGFEKVNSTLPPGKLVSENGDVYDMPDEIPGGVTGRPRGWAR